jgi:hypothetical protein
MEEMSTTGNRILHTFKVNLPGVILAVRIHDHLTTTASQSYL